ERNPGRQRLPDDGVRNSSDPWACGVDEHARGRDAAPAMVAEHELPFFAPLGTGAAGAGPDDGATFGGVNRVEHDQPGIVDRTIGVFEPVTEFALERMTGRMVGQIGGTGRG